MKNFRLFLLSAIIALMMHLFVYSQKNTVQRVLTMPVVIQNLPKDMMVLQSSIRQIQVTVKGPSFLVGEAAASDNSYKVDLPQDVGSEYSGSISPENLGLSSSLEVINIEPRSFTVELDKKIERNFPVAVPRLGRLADDLKLVSIQVIPAEVKLEGAKGEIDNIDYVQSEPINFTRIEKADVFKYNLQLRGKWENVQPKPSDIIAVVTIAPESSTRTFDKIPIEIRSREDRKVVITPQEVWVKVSGPKQMVEELSDDDIVAYVKVNRRNRKDVSIRFELPEGIKVIGWEPVKTSVEYFDLEESSEKSLEKSLEESEE